MSNLIKQNYEDARYEAMSAVRGYIFDIVGAIDFLNQSINPGAPSLHQFIEAHNQRLDDKSMQASASSAHGIAYLEHYGDLLQRAKDTFAYVASETERLGDREVLEELKGARRDHEEYENDHMPEVHNFFRLYATDIAAEKQTEQYARDKSVIENVRSELEQVTKTGQWTPDIVTVEDRQTGQPTQLEVPSSEKLGRIARMAPQLPRLKFGS